MFGFICYNWVLIKVQCASTRGSGAFIGQVIRCTPSFARHLGLIPDEADLLNFKFLFARRERKFSSLDRASSKVLEPFYVIKPYPLSCRGGADYVVTRMRGPCICPPSSPSSRILPRVLGWASAHGSKDTRTWSGCKSCRNSPRLLTETAWHSQSLPGTARRLPVSGAHVPGALAWWRRAGHLAPAWPVTAQGDGQFGALVCHWESSFLFYAHPFKEEKVDHLFLWNHREPFCKYWRNTNVWNFPCHAKSRSTSPPKKASWSHLSPAYFVCLFHVIQYQ